MQLDTWPEHRNNIEYLIHCAAQPFGVAMDNSPSEEQNLVSKENYYYLFSKVFTGSSKTRKDAALAIYDIYYGDDEEKAFNAFTKLISGISDPISVVSFYFFLKDKTADGDYQYVTTRKEGTGDRLTSLGLDASCVKKCTWEGYQKYLSIIREILALLKPNHPEATLLDAQSFLWMLHMIENDSPEYEKSSDISGNSRTEEDNRENPLETVVTHTSGQYKEGKRIEKYTVAYERDPKVRKAFLASIPKPYKCEACGMDFESVYGAIGKDVIDVHHKRPLYIDGVEQSVEPNSDYLACLCSNCHRIIHRKTDSIMTVEELKGILDKRS